MISQSSGVMISIVTVCFNSAKTIEQTIRSVINQSYKNLEYIIIDGGSTDGTLDIIRKYEPYIAYWVSEPDNGIYDAMNKGIEVANGELLAFINSDDWYHEDAMRHFAETYGNQPSDVLFGDIITISTNNIEKYISNANVNVDNMMYANKLCHQAICVRTALMKDSLFDLQYKIAADYDFLLKIYLNKYKFKYIGNHLIAYFRLSGISSVNIIDKINEHCAIATKRVLNSREICCNEGFYTEMRNKIENHRLYGVFQGICKDYKQKKCQINCDDFFTNKEYIVFGAGVVGRQLKQLLSTLGINVKCFIDNNPDLFLTNIDGVSVIDLHDIELIKGRIVLIASYEYSDEMAESLNSLGLKEDRDYYKFETWVKLMRERVIYGE